MKWLPLFFFSFFNFFIMCPFSAFSQEQLRIAVASNFADTLRTLLVTFNADKKFIISVSQGSTGKLYAQISNGAPFDVFLAADMQRPELLIANKQAVAGTNFVYARGILVLWGPGKGVAEKGPEFLRSSGWQTLAHAHPDHAPYGKAAVQVLGHLGIVPKVHAKIIRTEDVAQIHHLVMGRHVDAGFLSWTQLLSHGQFAEQDVWRIPLELYEPLQQGAVLLNRGKDNAAAKQFLAFLKSPQGQQLIRNAGYRSE